MHTKYFKKIMTGLSALNATGVPPMDQASQCPHNVFIAKFGANTTAGTVVIEGSATPDDVDTWVNLGTMAWSAALKQHSVTVSNGPWPALRGRISVAVVNGTVDLTAQGQG